ERDRVLDRLACDDVARTNALFDRGDQDASRFRGRVGLFWIRRSHLRTTHQAHAERLEGRRHGVGGKHSPTSPDSGTSVPLDAFEVFLGQLTGAKRTDGLEGA